MGNPAFQRPGGASEPGPGRPGPCPLPRPARDFASLSEAEDPYAAFYPFGPEEGFLDDIEREEYEHSLQCLRRGIDSSSPLAGLAIRIAHQVAIEMLRVGRLLKDEQRLLVPAQTWAALQQALKDAAPEYWPLELLGDCLKQVTALKPLGIGYGSLDRVAAAALRAVLAVWDPFKSQSPPSLVDDPEQLWSALARCPREFGISIVAFDPMFEMKSLLREAPHDDPLLQEVCVRALKAAYRRQAKTLKPLEARLFAAQRAVHEACVANLGAKRKELDVLYKHRHRQQELLYRAQERYLAVLEKM